MIGLSCFFSPKSSQNKGDSHGALAERSAGKQDHNDNLGAPKRNPMATTSLMFVTTWAEVTYSGDAAMQSSGGALAYGCNNKPMAP